MGSLHHLTGLLRCGCIALLLLCAQSAPAAQSEDGVDHLAIAEILLRDGALERAAAELAKVDPSADTVDGARYWTVTGLIELQRNAMPAAAAAFEKAIAAGQVEPLVQLYLAQAYFGQEQWPEVVATIERAGDALAEITGAWSMRAHALWMQGRRQQAMAVLSEATRRFPANNTFTRRQIFYLIEAGLHQEASRVALEFTRRADVGADDYAAIGGALRRAKSYEQSLAILEAARLRYPDNDNIAKSLAQTYVEAGRPLAAAHLLGAVAERDPGLLAEAAELYRRAGLPMKALALNQRVTDPAKKLKQRIGILVALKRYEQIVGMEQALLRAGLLDDEDVRYALAYSYFHGGDFAGAERHLSAITRGDLFRKATELRKLMEECADRRWACA